MCHFASFPALTPQGMGVGVVPVSLMRPVSQGRGGKGREGEAWKCGLVTERRVELKAELPVREGHRRHLFT